MIKYNYIQYTIVKGETHLFNVKAPSSQKENWEGTERADNEEEQHHQDKQDEEEMLLAGINENDLE